MRIRDIAIGAAVAGIMSGAGMMMPSSAHAEDKAAAEKNACNGPDGCGAKAKNKGKDQAGATQGSGKDSNSCKSPAGDKGKAKGAEKDKHACGGPNGCGSKDEKNKTN